MPSRLALLALTALLLPSCGEDRFDRRYRDAEAQIRREDKDLSSEMPGDAEAGSGVARAAAAPSPRP